MISTEKIVMRKINPFLILNKRSFNHFFGKCSPKQKKPLIRLFFVLGVSTCTFRFDFRIYLGKYDVYEKNSNNQTDSASKTSPFEDYFRSLLLHLFVWQSGKNQGFFLVIALKPPYFGRGLLFPLGVIFQTK